MTTSSRPNVVVTDHALLRYLERAHDVPIETIRKHIAQLAEGAAGVGATTITNGNARLVLKHNAINGEILVSTVLRVKMGRDFIGKKNQPMKKGKSK